MKDRAFTGKDVAEAVRNAALTLGLEEAELRYFVLDQGGEGRLGGDPSPARIAVLMDAPKTARPVPPPGPKPSGREGEAPAPLRDREAPPEATEADGEEQDDDLEAALDRVAAALGAAAGIELRATLEEDETAVTLHLSTSDPGFFLGGDGEGAPMKALEHLLHRMFAADVAPLKLRVEMEGYREARDGALRALAEAMAAEVRRTGLPRGTPALNAYERRIVHMAAAAAGGVVSKSEGEGAERRVVLHPAPEVSPGGEVH